MAAALVVLGVAAPAARAATEPVGGCHNGLTLATVKEMAAATYGVLVDHVTFPTVKSWAAFIDQADKNGDNYVCYTVGKPVHGHGDAQLIHWDDNKWPR